MRQNPHRHAVTAGPEVPVSLSATGGLPRRTSCSPSPGGAAGGSAAASLVERPEGQFRPSQGVPPGVPVPHAATGDSEGELGVIAVLARPDHLVERLEASASAPGPPGEPEARPRKRTRRPHPPRRFLRPTERVPRRERQERPFRPLLPAGETETARAIVSRHGFLPGSRGALSVSDRTAAVPSAYRDRSTPGPPLSVVPQTGCASEPRLA